MTDAPPSLARPCVAVVVPDGLASEHAQKLVAALIAQGRRAVIVQDGDPAMLAADQIILTGYLPRLYRTRALLLAARSTRPRVAAWVYEPLVPDDMAGWASRLAAGITPVDQTPGRRPWWRLSRFAYLPIALFGMRQWAAASTAKELQFAFGYTLWLRRGLDACWIDLAAVSTVQKGGIVSGWGHPWVFAPLSHDWDGGLQIAMASARDIDVLFLGRLGNPGRRARLRRIFRSLQGAGLNVRVVTHGLRGEARDGMLDRSKMILHLKKYPWDTAWMRFYFASSHGVAVASEPLSLPDPMCPGVDYLEAPVENLAMEIVRLVADEPRRAAMVAACRARIARDMTFDSGVARMSEGLSQAGVGRP